MAGERGTIAGAPAKRSYTGRLLGATLRKGLGEVRERVASKQNRLRQGLLTALITLIALLGFMAGLITRTLTASAAFNLGQRQNPEATATTFATQAPQLSPTASIEATTAPSLTHFTIRLTVSPSSGHVGDAIVITARVTNNATSAPVSGLTCHLRAPTNGANGLFTIWPTPTATDDAGVASWTTTIPTVAPGRYEIEVFAQTPSWSYVARAEVTVTAS